MIPRQPAVHPVDLESTGLCCCLECRSILRSTTLGFLRAIRPEVRPALRRRWPELTPNLFAIDNQGDHRC